LIYIDVTVPWFVCLFVCLSVTFVHCAQTAEDIDTIFFAYTTAPCLSQIALKFGLHRSTLPKFCRQVIPTPLLIWASTQTF